jgi:hypothetical protein
MAKAIFVEIIGNASQFKKELTGAVAATEKANTGFARMGRVAGTAGLALAGVLAIGLEKSVKAAMEAEAAHARLATAFKAAGLSATAYSKQIDAAESAMRNLGFTDVETMGALGSLVAATHNVSTATRDMATAADLARFKHLDLEQATKMLTMAMTGSQRAVKQLGITIIPVTAAVDALKRSNMDLSTEVGRAALKQAQLQDKMATGQQVIERTSELVKGQGEAYTQTSIGGMAVFHAQLQHLEESLGKVLIPVLNETIHQLTIMVETINTGAIPAFKAVRSAVDHVAGATTVLHAVWTYFLSPVAFLNRALIAVHAAMVAVDAIMRAVGAVSNAVAGAFDAVGNAAHAVASAVKGVLVGAFNAFKGVASGVMGVINAIAGALRAVASAARDVASALGSIHVPHISLPHIGLPHIPGTATGGIVTGPQIRLVGEAGPEAIIPLSKGFGGGGGDTYNFSFPNYVGSQRELIDMVRNGLNVAGKRNGGNMFGGQA